MKMLLDTHLILWAALGSKELPLTLCQQLEDSASELFFSVASLWEVAIKNGLGREDFQINISLLRRGLFDAGYHELPILSSHVMHIENLPLIHKDPFDRIMIAQASVEGIPLFTSDATVAKYPGPICLV